MARYIMRIGERGIPFSDIKEIFSFLQEKEISPFEAQVTTYATEGDPTWDGNPNKIIGSFIPLLADEPCES